MNRKPRVPDPFSTKNTHFFKVPMAFQMHQMSLKPLEKDVYIFFMIQVKYQKKLEIKTTLSNISYWTGIKNKTAISKAIVGLAEKGWIKDIIRGKQMPSIYIINLSPTVNPSLLDRIKKRIDNISKAKKLSIQKGEKGKFKKKEVSNP